MPFGRWRAAPRVRCSQPHCAAHVIVACFALIPLHCTLPLQSYSPTTALRPLTVRAASAERSNMHGHNFSAPAAQSDELRPVTAPQVCGRAGPSCRARPHASISAAADPGGSAPRIPTYSTAQEHTRAFQPGSTADMRSLLIDPALCRSTAAPEPRKAADIARAGDPGLLCRSCNSPRHTEKKRNFQGTS